MIDEWAAKDNLHVVGYVGIALYMIFFSVSVLRTVAVLPHVDVKHPKFAFHCAFTASFFFEMFYYLGFVVEYVGHTQIFYSFCFVYTI